MPVIPFRSRQQLRDEQTRIEQSVLRDLHHVRHEVHRLAAQGMDVPSIAAELGITNGCVHKFRSYP